MGLYNIWVTEKCNLKCTYCYENNKSAVSMSDETVRDMISFISERYDVSDYNMINFHGGEPMIAFGRIIDIIDTLSGKGLVFHYSLTTNALLLDEEKLKMLSARDVYISVSIDGDKYAHDMCRKKKDGTGSYDEVISKLPLIKQYFPRFRIRMTIAAALSDRLYDSVMSVSQAGADVIVAVPDLYDPEWTYEKIDALKYQLLELDQELNSEGTVFVFYKKPDICNPQVCAGGIEEINISVNGELYPCSFVTGNRKYIIGDVRSGISGDLLRKFSVFYGRTNPVCEGCGREKICTSSRCKFINAEFTGDFLTPSPILCGFENMMDSLERMKLNIMA